MRSCVFTDGPLVLDHGHELVSDILRHVPVGVRPFPDGSGLIPVREGRRIPFPDILDGRIILPSVSVAQLLDTGTSRAVNRDQLLHFKRKIRRIRINGKNITIFLYFKFFHLPELRDICYRYCTGLIVESGYGSGCDWKLRITLSNLTQGHVGHGVSVIIRGIGQLFGPESARKLHA